MPKLKEQGRVRAHRWRDSIFVQLVYKISSVGSVVLVVSFVEYLISNLGNWYISTGAAGSSADDRIGSIG